MQRAKPKFMTHSRATTCRFMEILPSFLRAPWNPEPTSLRNSGFRTGVSTATATRGLESRRYGVRTPWNPESGRFVTPVFPPAIRADWKVGVTAPGLVGRTEGPGPCSLQNQSIRSFGVKHRAVDSLNPDQYSGGDFTCSTKRHFGNGSSCGCWAAQSRLF